jgi:hypothetical protein
VNEERLGSTRDFAAQLAAHLEQFREPALALPSAPQLSALIEATFFASMHEEEARRVDFGVAWQPDARECSAVVAMATPLRVTPKNLAKLAPATWGEATSLAVRPDGPNGDDIVAWALLERNGSTHQPLTIRALDVGVLRVDYGGIPRALYERGEIVLLGGADDFKSPAWWLTQTFADWREHADPRIGVDLRAAVLTGMALQVLTHGHGGMILVMPAGTGAPHGVRVHYDVTDGADILFKRYGQLVRDIPVEGRLARLKGARPRSPDGRTTVRDSDQLALAETIERVARLTAVDNALLLDTDLNIRGFGVQVVEGETPKLEFRHSNPYSRDVHFDDLSTFKGTRHPAGVIYCMRQPREAAAVIVSQDGHITLAVKDADHAVHVIGSYEHAFGWR